MSAAGAFSPFRHTAFSLLWVAMLLANIGGWMHDLAAGWLMTTLVPEPAWVAMVQAATTLPVCLLSIPAGTLADRFDRRKLLILARTIMVAVTLVLFAVVLAGKATPLFLLGMTFLMGVGTAVTSPAWQAVLPALVPRVELPPAVALHAVGMNIARAIGPALGGVLIIAAGIAWPFLFNAVSAIAILAALAWWKPPAAPVVNHEPFFTAMMASFTHVGQNLALRNALLRSVLFYVFGSCYWALLPLVAHDLLQGTARLYGLLVGAIGVGAVSGALILPPLRKRLGLGGTVVAGTLGTALAMTGYALLREPALGLLASLLAGISWLATLSSLNVAAQLAVPDTMRARGMALYTAVFYGCLALGSLGWGQVATHIGLVPTLLVASAGAVLALLPAQKLRLH
ncbi:MAG: MFS transporter [Steroidobacteraceae bacterium]